jgi:hypothetical protein
MHFLAFFSVEKVPVAQAAHVLGFDAVPATFTKLPWSQSTHGVHLPLAPPGDQEPGSHGVQTPSFNSLPALQVVATTARACDGTTNATSAPTRLTARSRCVAQRACGDFPCGTVVVRPLVFIGLSSRRAVAWTAGFESLLKHHNRMAARCQQPDPDVRKAAIAAYLLWTSVWLLICDALWQ